MVHFDSDGIWEGIKATMLGIGIALLAAVLLTVGAILFIWSLNVLFGFSIAFSLKTILAAVLFVGILRGNPHA